MSRSKVQKFPDIISVTKSEAGVLGVVAEQDVTNNYVATYRLESVALRRVVVGAAVTAKPKPKVRLVRKAAVPDSPAVPSAGA
jgi:hypothetical protein